MRDRVLQINKPAGTARATTTPATIIGTFPVEAGAGAECGLATESRNDLSATPAMTAAALPPACEAQADAKSEKDLLTSMLSANASLSAVAKFADDWPKAPAIAVFVMSTESVMTMELGCRRRAFIALVPSITSPAGSLMMLTIEKADAAFATPISVAHEARSRTPSEGALIKLRSEPPGSDTSNITVFAAGAGKGEDDR